MIPHHAGETESGQLLAVVLLLVACMTMVLDNSLSLSGHLIFDANTDYVYKDHSKDRNSALFFLIEWRKCRNVIQRGWKEENKRKVGYLQKIIRLKV